MWFIYFNFFSRKTWCNTRRSNVYYKSESVVIIQSKELSPVLTNKTWKEQHPNTVYWNNTNHQNHVPGSGYPNVKKPSPLGMVSILILSTGLVVTIFIFFNS